MKASSAGPCYPKTRAESSQHWTFPLAGTSLLREPQVSWRCRLEDSFNSAVLCSCCRWVNSLNPLGSETTLKAFVPSRVVQQPWFREGLLFQHVTWPTVAAKKIADHAPSQHKASCAATEMPPSNCFQNSNWKKSQPGSERHNTGRQFSTCPNLSNICSWPHQHTSIYEDWKCFLLLSLLMSTHYMSVRKNEW